MANPRELALKLVLHAIQHRLVAPFRIRGAQLQLTWANAEQ